MLNLLRRIFRTPTPSRTPAPASDRDAFLRQLGESNIYVIAALQSDGIDPATMTEDQLLAEAERAVKDISERQGFQPFVYEADGQRRVPFFTSVEHAETFAGAYSKRHDRVYPFEVLGVEGTLLAKLLPWCDVLVMNDSGDEEVVLSDDDADAIRRMWGA